MKSILKVKQSTTNCVLIMVAYGDIREYPIDPKIICKTIEYWVKIVNLWGQASFSSARPFVFRRLTSRPLPEPSCTCHVFLLTRPLATQPAKQADLRSPAPAVSHEAGASCVCQDGNKERRRETRSQRS